MKQRVLDCARTVEHDLITQLSLRVWCLEAPRIRARISGIGACRTLRGALKGIWLDQFEITICALLCIWNWVARQNGTLIGNV